MHPGSTVSFFVWAGSSCKLQVPLAVVVFSPLILQHP